MEVPIVYVYLYHKLKERNNGWIVKTPILKEILKRYIICGDHHGGSRKGLPREYIYDVIKDMEKLELIKKINLQRYEILKHKCEKKLKKQIWE